MKVGRPTKYHDGMIEIAKEYIASCGREQTELPTIEGLADKLDVDDERISEYAQKHPKFHATIKKLKAKQKTQLMNDGMYGGKEVNSTMAIFLLKVNHEMIETERRLIGGDKDNPIEIKQTLDDSQKQIISEAVTEGVKKAFKPSGSGGNE